jgi:hypothetical protein
VDSRLLAVLGAALLLGLLLLVVPRSCSAPSPPSSQPHQGGTSESPPIGSDSALSGLPRPVLFGGIQFLVAGAALIAWRARRRGALVADPRPVDAPAGEVLAGRAELYRRSRDQDHVAGLLRYATLRRLRSACGLPAEATAAQVAAAVCAQAPTLDPARVHAGLVGPVPDEPALAVVTADLYLIERCIGSRA